MQLTIVSFNSFTQQICIDNAVVGISDPEDTQPIEPTRGTYVPIANDTSPVPVKTVDTKKPVSDILDDLGGNGGIVRYPSQIVTYSSKYVSKLSDVSNELNISGSLSIRYGEISGGGSGSYVNTETFQNSDLNFLVTVNVINQTINLKDQLQFWPLTGKRAADYDAKRFTDVFGDSFISGFQEGGQFSAIVSIRAFDSKNVTDIKASAHLALQVGVGSVDAEGKVSSAKENLQKNSEVNITINWSGGGQLKADDRKWDIDTLQEVAVRFADHVASTPQRTHAILTKYTALRGYLQWKAEQTWSPLNFDLANLYISELLDVYMGYKSIWKQLHAMLDQAETDASLLVRAPPPPYKVYFPQQPTGDPTKPGKELTVFEPSIQGLDQALRQVRDLMARIALENDAITQDPSLAVKADRPLAYLRPQSFRLLLPYYQGTLNPPIKLGPRSGSISQRWPGVGMTSFSTAIQLMDPKLPTEPSIVLCYNLLDTARRDSRQITRASPLNFLTTGEGKIDSYQISVSPTSDYDLSSNQMFGVDCRSLAIPGNDRGFQTGYWSSTYRESLVTATPIMKETRTTVKFPQPYSTTPPQVAVFLAGWDIDSSSFVNVAVSAEFITTTGFDITVRAIDRLRKVYVSWFACPYNAPNWAVGSSEAPWTAAGVNLGTLPKQAAFTGTASFGSKTFSDIPSVMCGIRGFSVGNEQLNIRLRTEALTVDKSRFTYSAGSWSDTKLTGSAVSWIAWDDPPPMPEGDIAHH